MIFRTICQLIILLQLPLTLLAQSDESFVKDWVSHPVPEVHTLVIETSNYHYVSVKDDDIIASKISADSAQNALPFTFTPSGFLQDMNMNGSRSVFKVDDGYLVGFDNGEFGGSLYWFSKNGDQKYQISAYHVKQFYKTQDTLYAIEGIEHMGFDSGNLLVVSMVNGKWTVDNSLKLPSDPKAIGVDSKSNVVLATTTGLLSVSQLSKITVLKSYQKWRPRIDQGVLIFKNDVVYVGMEEGIYKFDLVSGKADWLLPN